MSEYITDSAGNELCGLTLRAGETLALRCYSDDGTTDARINAVRVDCREESPASEDAETATLQGQDLIDDGSIEGRLIAGSFANCCKFANALELGAISAGSYVAFELRTTIESGVVAFGLAIRAL